MRRCKESKESRSKEKQQKNRDVERETACLLSSSIKEQTKNRGHLITRALDQRGRVCRNKKRDGRGHEVHLGTCVCLCKCMCVIWGVSESLQTGPHCAAGSNEGGNEGLGFQSCPLQVHRVWAQGNQGTGRAERGGGYQCR